MPLKFLSQGKSLLTLFYNQCFITFFENCCYTKAYFKHLLTLAILIVPFLLCPFAFSAEITMAWDSNSESDLAGYKIYYGTSSRNYSHSEDVGNVTEYTIVDLQEGVTYYIAAKAYNYSGSESSFSGELVYTLPNTNENSSPTRPSVPSGPSSGSTETLYNFNTSSGDPDGDSLEYRYDWGDSNLSSWRSSSSQTHTWSSPGNFCVRSMARDSHDATSGWSNCHNITISAPPPISHTITASAGINGRISPSGNLTVNNGANQSFTIIPDNSYHVLDVLVNGVTVGAMTSYTFTNITQNHTISAGFSLNNQPPIANAGPNQTVSDGDGVPDSEEVFPSDPNEWRDTVGVNKSGGEIITEEVRVTANSDDAEESASGSMNLASYDLELINDHGDQTVGIRFVGVGIPQGVTISDAYVQFQTDEMTSQATALTIEAQDTDNAQPFTYSTWNISNRATTGAGVWWAPAAWTTVGEAGAAQRTPDLSSIIQEVVNRSGWSSGNSLVLIITGTGRRVAESHEVDHNGAPLLHVEYSTGPAANRAPYQPEIYSPTNENMVDLIPVLEASAFYDGDVDDYHAGTQWQIFEEENDFCILNITTGVSLTSLNVPRLILTENTNYYWKLRYFDNAGRPSKWSEPAYFLTDANFADMNNDGVPDHQEVEGIQDLDSDGIDDESQEDIKVIKSEVGTANIGIRVKESDTVLEIISVETEDPNELQPNLAGNVPTPKDLPFGLIDFKIIVEQPGDQAVVTIFFSEAAPEGSKWYKYDPIERSWYDYSAYSEFSENRKSVTVLVKDGGFGDLDGVENGIIIDPAGIGVNLAGNGAITTSSGGGGGGCFISAAAASKDQANPTINPRRWRQIAGIVAVLSILFVIYRRRVRVFNL